jgi:GNAT superfamily N-acetyltransferase
VEVFTVSVLALATASTAAAQIQPGRVYAGGEQVSDPSAGLRLTIPAGWRGALAPDGESFQLRSDAGGSVIVVLADEMTEAEARAQMGAPVDLGDGVVLTPRGEVRAIASGHLSAPYAVRGTQVELEGVVDVRLTASGLGVAFILLAPPGSMERDQDALRELALSLGVEAPAVQTGANDEWQPWLRGRYLARFYTASGYTESTELWLCSDGSFFYDSQGGGFGGGASGAAQSTGGGRWSATGAGRTGTLILEWGNGERSSMALEYDYEADRLYVDGERMLRGPNERCG